VVCGLYDVHDQRRSTILVAKQILKVKENIWDLFIFQAAMKNRWQTDRRSQCLKMHSTAADHRYDDAVLVSQMTASEIDRMSSIHVIDHTVVKQGKQLSKCSKVKSTPHLF